MSTRSTYKLYQGLLWNIKLRYGEFNLQIEIRKSLQAASLPVPELESKAFATKTM